MESIKENDDKISKKEGFFSYVFNFEEDNKNTIMNYFQYSFLAIPLVILSLKSINYITPEEDPTKGTLEIFFEVFGTISLILLSIWFINRIIRVIPTYSQSNYPTFNEINFIIPLFIALFTMQTKLGSKINILLERLVDMWEGNREEPKGKKDYKTKQPITNGQHQPSQADRLNQVNLGGPPTMSTNINPEAMNGMTDSQHINQVHNNAVNQGPNFNKMFQGPNTPLVDAATPGGGNFEPMAANEGFGLFGGSAF